MSIKGHRDLEVWRLAIAVVVEAYEATKRFPDSELFGLTSQIRRAAVSVPANIAEGRCRSTRRDFARHVDIARGSLAELDTHFVIAEKLGYIQPAASLKIQNSLDRIGRMLSGLRKALRRSDPNRTESS